ncbi:MAG: type II secretion system inner membrane protein GspF [Methylomonas sp.]|nr:type II secretion system inner membrane protein GspF [Methylomonas sp.]PPD21418.1 MAG: type II secretion system protein GspF [Methylomonas sp.]PPD24898.1 MAG: type II secretion system protein GspF [Methylomonas sp.]PPD33894.1 MAG: type II secretion system protein GspF [Methylomonas sp.]PPD41457.1 MAG: type II secretion system protein GspF [Methylomonas sp.]
MAAFEYQAIDGRGRTVKGTLESDSAKSARQQLKVTGLTLLAIQEIHKQENRQRASLWTQRIGMRALTHITRQLAALLKSGLAIDEALAIVARQSESAKARRIVTAIRTRVVEGQSLAQACQGFPSSFPPMYRATVEAGESSGKLDQVLEKLADYLSDKGQLHRKLQMAMIYPVLLTGVSLLVVIGLLTYVVPEITGVFDKMGQQLPAITRGLIASSDFFKDYGLMLVVLLIVLTMAFKWLMRRDEPRMRFHRWLLRWPLTAKFSRGLNTARFTRTLAILTNSGVELLTALRIASQVLGNDAMRKAVETAALRVREGQSLNRALESSRFFPPVTIHLIASGEASGQLPRMLESAADDQERDIQALTELTMGLFEPALILTMGLLVLVIVLAILLPIFEMNQLIR